MINELDKLYELCKSNQFKLAFALAEGMGITPFKLINLLWDKYSVEFQNLTEIYFNLDVFIFKTGNHWYYYNYNYSAEYSDRYVTFKEFVNTINNGN